MSYQIKSTPYFRRMFNNSKKNGQLQRLREEYERIQEFNDRTIELKMRQVRLKRLFREIEEIKEGGGGGVGFVGGSSAAGVAHSVNAATRATAAGARGGGFHSPPSVSYSARRAQHRHTHSHSHNHSHNLQLRLVGFTPEQRRRHQRAETLIRSRELGKELSRRNAQATNAGMVGSLRADLRATAKMRAVVDAQREAQERRERAAKRISYGNDQSRQNLQRQLKAAQRRLMAKHYPQPMPGHRLHNHLYQHLTTSQLDLIEDEEELAAEQQRYFREEEEDELQLAEERYRRQEERLRLEVVSSDEEGQQDREELRYFGREQATSEEEGQHQLKRQGQGCLFGNKNRLSLVEERLRLEADYSDDGRQEDQEEEHPQVDEKETEQQTLDSFSLSSTTENDPCRSQKHPAALSSEPEMVTAPLATEEQMATPSSSMWGEQPGSASDELPALNNWRRVSMMLPWFKFCPIRKATRHRATPRFLGRGHDPAEPHEPRLEKQTRLESQQ